MFNRRILVSLMVIGIVGTVAAGSGTLALFSDTETSEDNTFTAGSIDARFGAATTTSNGGLSEINNNNNDEISVTDIKPLDTKPKEYFGLEVSDNPSYLCLAVTNVDDLEGESPPTDPEQDAGDNSPNVGELSDYLKFTLYEEPEDREVGTFNQVSPGVYELVDNSYALFSDLNAGDPYPSGGPGRSDLLSIQVGMEDGSDVNQAQTDSTEIDLALYAVQYRNNEDFECESLTVNSDGEIVEEVPS